MTASLVWLADAEGFGLEDVVRGWRTLTPETREGFIVFGALLFVTATIFVWAAFFRKRGRQRHSRHHHHKRRFPEPAAAGGKDGEAGNPVIRSRYRHRHRRRRHREDRPRNPTLAETGGLPPYRADEPPNPSFH